MSVGHGQGLVTAPAALSRLLGGSRGGPGSDKAGGRPVRVPTGPKHVGGEPDVMTLERGLLLGRWGAP